MKTQFTAQYRATAIIALFISVQMALPLSYYFGDNIFDERFAWRMFSPTRMARCQVGLEDVSSGVSERIRLNKHLHIVWINLLKRARPTVIDAVTSKFCKAAQGKGLRPDVRLSLSCSNPDASTLGICRGQMDRNQDGVPDGYTNAPDCRDKDPANCFKRDCDGDDAGTCFKRRCKLTLATPDTNQCVGAL
jgi:hypothetical protein